jgi:hypothetical protein
MNNYGVMALLLLQGRERSLPRPTSVMNLRPNSAKDNKQSSASSESHNLKLSATLKIRPNLLPRRGPTAGNNL